MKTIAFYGSSLVSSYWNGAATYYRGIIKALHGLGYRTTFYEPDVFGRQDHRDMADPDWCDVVVYPGTQEGLKRAAAEACRADIVIKASGVGYEDDLLFHSVIEAARPDALIVFWDVDAPATLGDLHQNNDHPLHRAVRACDLVLTYGGGEPVASAYRNLGARACIPIYNALDPETHHRVGPDPRFAADLAFLGNRLPDREHRVEEFFFRAARDRPDDSFILGGSGWSDKALPGNVTAIGHVGTNDHNAFNVTPKAVLNISRESMAEYGFSPATRVFEAAGAGACLITDHWEGIPLFLEPGSEVLVARDGQDVCEIMAGLTSERSAEIGEAARRRVLTQHTYAERALDVDRVFQAAKPKLEAAQ